MSPKTFAKLALRAKPDCPLCRGLGYLYYREDPVFALGEPAPINPAFVSACKCVEGREAPSGRE